MRATSSSSSALRVASAPRDVLVGEDGLLELVADREERVERGHRLLEDHRQVDPADFPGRGAGVRWVMSTTRPSRLRSRIVPESVRTWCSSPMTRRMVTVFPDPDSPTIASVSPRSHAEGDAVQDGAEPAVNRKAQREVADGQDLVRRHRGMSRVRYSK